MLVPDWGGMSGTDAEIETLGDVWAGNGEVRASVDHAADAMRNRCLHHIVATAGAHIPGNAAIPAQDGQVNDCIHALGRGHDPVQIGCVEQEELAGQIFLRRFDIGDA